MNEKLKKSLENLVPFIIFGLVVAAVIGLISLIFHLFVWGVLIGAVLWVIYLIKNYFTTSKKKSPHKDGRIIEHESKK